MLETEKKREHEFCSDARERIKISGVSDVISFDERGVSLETVCGNMAVEGEDLRVKTLNTSDGVVEIEGRINGVYYYDNKPTVKRGLFARKSD